MIVIDVSDFGERLKNIPNIEWVENSYLMKYILNTISEIQFEITEVRKNEN